MIINKLRMGKLVDALRRFSANDAIDVKLSAKIAEFCALMFVMISATLTYLYGSFLVIPVVFAEYPYITIILLWVLTTWIFFGVCANMYLVRKRNSSIQNRLLLQPVVKPMSSNISVMESDVQVRETARHMGEHFKHDPFGEGHNWHICAACEAFVPPRCWHCHSCNTCILRRDHHCVFTGCCIGEENQSNFLGLLLYLGCGTSISAVLSCIYSIYFQGMGVWWYLFRLFAMIYTLFFDFQITLILASISTMGQMAAWGVFAYYFYISMKGQTSADVHRKIVRTLPGARQISFKNMTEFLGPNPLLRIVWPFHPPFRADYSPKVFTDDDRRRQAISYSPFYYNGCPTNSDQVFDFETKSSYDPYIANSRYYY